MMIKMKNLKLFAAMFSLLAFMACSEDEPEVEICDIEPFANLLIDGTCAFTDANDVYFFEDYSVEVSDIAVSVDEDCSTITLTGDFLDWQSTIDENYVPVLTLDATPGATEGQGTISFTELLIGEAPDGFTYRLNSSGQDGTYNSTTRSLQLSFFVEYQVDGEWVYWYTSSIDLAPAF